MSATLVSSDTNGCCFDCHICFDCAQEPVVTLCGHLFCWACIFKWLHFRSSEPMQNCPVCKADISEASLVPLYGRGSSRGSINLDLPVPPRPPATATGLVISSHPNQQLHPHHPLGSRPSSLQHHHFHLPYHEVSSSSNLGGTVMEGIVNPAREMLGELVHTKIWGSSNTGLFTYPSSYSSLVGGVVVPLG
ncbi:hypothetical protein Dimus_018987 [Dionaea muscipula]